MIARLAIGASGIFASLANSIRLILSLMQCCGFLVREVFRSGSHLKVPGSRGCASSVVNPDFAQGRYSSFKVRQVSCIDPGCTSGILNE